jgi:hypothetical protein
MAVGAQGNFLTAMAVIAREEGVPALYKARCGACLPASLPACLLPCCFAVVLCDVVVDAVSLHVQGLDASLVGVVPYTAIRLSTYDALKAVWRRSTGRAQQQQQQQHCRYVEQVPDTPHSVCMRRAERY